MPLINFRVTLQNNSDFQLTLTASHLCVGNWTDAPGGYWTPPPCIAPQGGIGAWQTENDNIFHGTEGWVKYSLAVTYTDNQGKKLPDEQVYIYWNNPLVGSPDIPPAYMGKKSLVVSDADVTPDCDPPDRGGGSQFKNTADQGAAAALHELFSLGAGVTDEGGINYFVDFSNPLSSVTEFFREHNGHLYAIVGVRKKKAALCRASPRPRALRSNVRVSGPWQAKRTRRA
jgi:hypothetical protein